MVSSISSSSHPSPGSSSSSSSSLPSNVTRLPASVTDLVSCVSHEIMVIENELDQQTQHDIISERKLRTTDEERLLEDAIDDGFMCVDLKVLERKLKAWHRLFSPAFDNNNNDNDNNYEPSSYNYTVTPYFAVKCNPDACVVEWLARTASMMNLPLGYDCASIAELELAKAQIQKYSLEETDGGIDKKRNNIPATRIVYANPQRAEADLMHALELFATTPSQSQSQSKELELWLTLDGVEEVYKIATARKLFLEKHHACDALRMPNVKIVLRIWVPDGHSQVPLGEKFGMRMEEIDNVVEACLNHGIIADDIIGISYHCGSGCSSVETYLEALEMGRKALTRIDDRLTRHYREEEEEETDIQEKKVQKLDESQQKQYKRHRCWLLDMGGGFPGIDGLDGDDNRFSADAKKEVKETTDTSMPATTQQTATTTTTTVADIAMAVRPVLQSLTNINDKDENDSSSLPLTLIAEPGRYFVEGAIALASRIYQKQQVNDPNDDSNKIREYRIPHGVQGVFKDVLLCGESFIPQPLQIIEGQSNDLDDPATHADDQQDSSKQESPPKLYLSRVLGPSGDDTEDVVCDSCLLPELDVGDWLVFDRMGAYTLSIASRAGRPVMRYVRGDSSSPLSSPM